MARGTFDLGYSYLVERCKEQYALGGLSNFRSDFGRQPEQRYTAINGGIMEFPLTKKGNPIKEDCLFYVINL